MVAGNRRVHWSASRNRRTFRQVVHQPHLLADELSLSYIPIILPFTNKQFAQEGIQRLLLTSQLLATAAILLMESCEEPFQNKECTLCRVFLAGGRDENRGVFCPVRGEFDEGL